MVIPRINRVNSSRSYKQPYKGYLVVSQLSLYILYCSYWINYDILLIDARLRLANGSRNHAWEESHSMRKVQSNDSPSLQSPLFQYFFNHDISRWHEDVMTSRETKNLLGLKECLLQLRNIHCHVIIETRPQGRSSRYCLRLTRIVPRLFHRPNSQLRQSSCIGGILPILLSIHTAQEPVLLPDVHKVISGKS